MVGEKYGRLTVVSDAPKVGKDHMWELVCDCGNRVVTRRRSVTSGLTQSCGCLARERRREATIQRNTKHVLEMGDRFARWTVQRADGGKWRCRCDCGTERAVEGWALVSGASQSCGCLRADAASATCLARNGPLGVRRNAEAPTLAGQRFGRLLAVRELEEPTRGNLNKRRYECLCDCGRTHIASEHNLRNSGVRSCGCLQREAIAKTARMVAARFVGPRMPPLERGRWQVRQLSDGYVALTMRKHVADVVPGGIEMKREQLYLRRLARSLEQAATKAKEHE